MRAPVADLALALQLEEARAVFEPGARVAGVASWSAPAAPRGMELRLSWALYGKGGRDLKIVETIALPGPQATERRPFLFTLPSAPYSFRGTLLTLGWALELVALPGQERAQVNLIVAPGRQGIDLRDREPRR